MSRHIKWHLIMIIGIAALIVTGLPGCGGGGDQVADTGSVAGVIQYYRDGTALESIKVTVGGKSAYSDSNGNFTITGIAPGSDQAVTITPPDWLEMPPADPMLVDVTADQTTTLSETIVLVDAYELPEPWTESES